MNRTTLDSGNALGACTPRDRFSRSRSRSIIPIAIFVGCFVASAAANATAVRGTEDLSWLAYSLSPGGGGNPLPFTEYPEGFIFDLIDYESPVITASYAHEPYNGSYGYGSGFVRADYATGRLRARAVSTDDGGDGANIELHDRIFISGPLDAPIDIQISMAYEGTIVNSHHNTSAYLWLWVDGQGINDSRDSVFLRDDGHYDDTLTVSIPIYPDQPYFDLYAGIWTHSDAPPGDLTYVDFSQTAALSLTLPTGYSFTSESGIFLTQTLPVRVPEPGSIALIRIGLLVVGLVRCRIVSRDRTGLPGESVA